MFADAATRGTEIIVLISIVVPLTVLAIVIVVFFRSARRFDERERQQGRG